MMLRTWRPRCDSLGFEVTLVLNATRQQMEDALAVFRRQLRPGGVGLFYFAGHGAQVEGTNYLIPIGANVEKAATATAESVSAEQVLAEHDRGWHRPQSPHPGCVSE